MKKEPLQNLKRCTGRYLLAILALLMVPTGMWAEDYDLWVAGTQVSSDNASDVLGDGKVSWNNSSNTLTLNGATINGTIVSNVNSAITIHLIGTSTITTTQNQMPIQSSLSTEPGLTFTAAEGAMLLTNKTRTNGDAEICSGFSFSSEQDIPEGYRLSWDADEICSLAEYYDIYFYTFVNNSQYFQPYYVTAANCDRLMGTYNETSNQWDNNTIAVSYNYSQKTLTLNNAIFESAEPYNTTYFLNCDGYKAKTLTINLLGENKFIQNSNEPGAKFATMNVYEGNFIITTDANNPGSLTSVDLYSEDSEYFNFINGDVEYQNGLEYSYAGDGIRYIKTSSYESYDLWIDGEQVTSANASNITGNNITGTVSYDATSHTLTLIGAKIGSSDSPAESCAITYVGSEDLTIEVYGTGNELIGSGGCDAIRYNGDETSSPRLIFVKGDSQLCELYMTGSDVIAGFGEVGFDGLNLLSDNDPGIHWDDYSCCFKSYDGYSVNEVTLTSAEVYPIWVWYNNYNQSHVQVTAANKANIMGENDNTVSFDGNHTLTFNNAAFTELNEQSAIVVGPSMTALSVNLVGSSTIDGTDLQGFHFVAPSILTFTTDESNPGSLTMIHGSIVDSNDNITLYYNNGLGRLISQQDVITTDWVRSLYIDGVSDEITEDYTSQDESVKYVAETHTLTLTNATINGGISSNIDHLIINLVGTNNIGYIGSGGDADTSVEFTGDGTLTFSWQDGVMLGFNSVDFGEYNLLSNSTPGIHWDEMTKSLRTYDNNAMAGELTLTKDVVYPLWINGVQVTGDNAANVLDDGIKSVSYDSTNQILTLRGANFGGYDAAPIMVGEEISALTLHLIGNSSIYADGAPIIVFANASSSLTVTTSDKLPGCLTTINLSTVEPTLQNGLTYSDGTISASLANTEVSQFTGKSIYVNTENGEDNSYIYSSPDFYASYATGEDGGAFVKVSTREGATTATMWSGYLSNPELLYKVTLQFGALTASDATVQVIGWGQEYDNDGYPTGIFVADGKTYSNAIALSTADADGIIEIPLTSAVTSENLQLVFSSSSSFSFMPISIAFTSTPVYDIRIGNIAVTDNNASNITGEGITGSVSYDDETHTLTLNNATIEPEMEAAGIDYTGTADLTICLIGSSTVYGAENCEAIRYNGDGETTPNLIFAKGDDQTCSLYLSAYDNVISGFDNVDYGGMFTLNDEDDGIYTTIITSTLLGGGTGTADDPFLIKTPEDLKKFAQYNNSGVISRQASVKLNNSINCEELEDFEPIGDNTFAFAGTFNGNNCTISNLEFVSEEDGTWYAGLFGRVEGSAVIEKLTLSNCTFKGGSNVGTIAAYLASGTIQDCNVNACEVETRSSQNPYAGGITGEIENGTVQRCKVVGSTVKCVTSYDEEGGETTSGGIAGYINQGTISACEVENATIRSSHVAADGYQTAAGIVGTCNMWSEGSITISNNMVKGTTTVSAEDNTPEGESGTPLAGAVVGLVSPSSTLSNNTYEYSVTISTKAADAAASTVSGYTQRGSGSKIEFEGSDGYPELYAELTDDFENNGAVMYTKKVTLPEETDAASVMGEEGTYYSTVVESDVLSILVAPGQTVTLNATPGEGYAITSLTATNTTTEAAISTNSEELGDNVTQYTFTMPDAPVTVALLTAQTIANVFVAGLENAVYTGETIVPQFTVKASADAEANLVEGTDYEVSYKQGETIVESMINAGTYTIVISGIGAYYGTKDVSFEIAQANTTIAFAQESYSAILGESFTSPETVDNWEVTPWASENESVATVSEGVITINGVGTTTITVFYAGDENHLSTTASYQLVVSRNLEVAFVGSNSWASYYATENLALPEGLTAYVVSDVNETSGVVTVESIGYIPANNGVLLKRADGADADGYVAGAYTGSTSSFTNMLSGSTNTKAISSFGSDPVYVLFNDKFKRATSGTIPARRAYLFLPTTNAGGAPQLLTLNVVDGISTAISTLAADDNDGSWYTLDGFKLSGKPQHKGVYIKNGKKVYYNNHK